MMSYRSTKWMLLGLVAVVVISLSVAIVRQRSGEAKRRDCQVDLEKVGKAFRLYQTDYGCLPEEATDRWVVVSLVYDVKFKPHLILDCLSFGYGDNQLLGPKTSLDVLPSITALVWDGFEVVPEEMETWRKSPKTSIPGLDRKRHNNPNGYEGANMLLVDGHAAFFYARTPPEKLLPFFDPTVAKKQTKISIREGEPHEARGHQ